MQYLRLNDRERARLLADLAEMPGYLASTYAQLSDAQARSPRAADAFAPVEQAWHLADLEREGFGLRIRRLLAEQRPALPDFDGAAIARQRDYRSRSLAEGLEAFARARADNLALLARIPEDAWTRAGTQEGVGPVRLCDLPAFMHEHDAAHRAEIEAWRSLAEAR